MVSTSIEQARHSCDSTSQHQGCLLNQGEVAAFFPHSKTKVQSEDAQAQTLLHKLKQFQYSTVYRK